MKCRFLVVPFILLFLLSSCVVTQSLSLKNSSSEAMLETSPFLLSVLEDLSCWTGTDDQDAFMDVAVTSVARGIANSDYSTYVYINKADNATYSIKFGFSDFNKLITQLSEVDNQNIINLTESEANTCLSINISMDNYDVLTNIIPLLKDPNFEAYGPIYNNPPYDFRTEEDYMYMMEFIFGEEASVISQSTISIEFEAPRDIINTNGRLISDNSVVFEFRLIDFLLLHEPISFSCTY